jgi:hypothetical protein
MPTRKVPRDEQQMNGSGSLRIGSVVLSNLRDAVGDELLAVFRDDMLALDWIPAQQYYTATNGYNEPATGTDKPVKVIRFRGSGQAIADRLDVMGVDPVSALAYLDDFLRDRTDDFFVDHRGHPYDPEFRSGLDDDARAEFDQERGFRESLSASSWVEMLAATPEEPPGAVIATRAAAGGCYAKLTTGTTGTPCVSSC